MRSLVVTFVMVSAANVLPTAKDLLVTLAFCPLLIRAWPVRLSMEGPNEVGS